MKQQGIRLFVLAGAIAVNAAALVAAHVAMVDGADRVRLTQDVERIVIWGERPTDTAAAENCTGRQTL